MVPKQVQLQLTGFDFLKTPESDIDAFLLFHFSGTSTKHGLRETNNAGVELVHLWVVLSCRQWV